MSPSQPQNGEPMEPIPAARALRERLGPLGVFVEVVERGSFAAAAKRLGVTRSAVGKAILRLETELGAQLFQRTTRRLSTTEQGQLYYEHARRAVLEMGEAEAAIAQGKQGPAGVLRVTAPQALGRHFIARVMAALAQEHPRLEVEMSFSDRVADLVAERFDLAVRIGELANSATLQSRRIGVQRFGMFASPAYLRRHGTPARLADLAGHVAITYYSPEHGSRWAFPAPGGKLQEVAVRRMLSVDDIDAIAGAVLAGYGIGRLPWWMAMPLVKRRELAPVLEQDYHDDSDVHVVWPRTRMLALKTRVAIDTLVRAAPAVLLTTAPAQAPAPADPPARGRERQPGRRRA